MKTEASNTITLNDTLIGDAWACSGQANMELPMRRVKPLYEAEINSYTHLTSYALDKITSPLGNM